MKYFKGKLYLHKGNTTEGESDHFYCWLGKPNEAHKWEKHVQIGEGDILEIVEPSGKSAIIICGFPPTLKELEGVLKQEKTWWDVWLKALKNHWPVEVVKLVEKENLH